MTPIRLLLIQDLEQARAVLAVQQAAYQVEAELIGSTDIPPLTETLADLQQCGETFYGYWLNGELAGAISYKKIPGQRSAVLDIYRLVVHPFHFRRGIGRALLQFVETLENDIERLTVSTGRDNLPAKQLYIAMGFTPVRDEEVVPGFLLSDFAPKTPSKAFAKSE